MASHCWSLSRDITGPRPALQLVMRRFAHGCAAAARALRILLLASAAHTACPRYGEALVAVAAAAAARGAAARTALAPRPVGRCTIDGPCERFPQQGGRRDDNEQGYLLYGAGISLEHCVLRAHDHHAWCGNHPDAAVHAAFEREARAHAAASPTHVDAGQGSFPPVLAPPPAATGDRAVAECTESYQLARGSSWPESFCELQAPGRARRQPRGWSPGGAPCASDERQHWLRMQALSDTSVFLCRAPRGLPA